MRAYKPSAMRMRWGFALMLMCLLPMGAVQAEERIIDVRAFGAVGDGETLDTQAIQRAIDHAHKSGGGTVLFPTGGEFLTGTLMLKSNVTLHVARDAVIRGTREREHYPDMLPDEETYGGYRFGRHALIQAIDAENVGIKGEGVIDGDGVGITVNRHRILHFFRCTNVHVRDVTLKNPASWTQWYLESDHVHVDNVTVRSFNLDPHQPNGDGINISGCRNVLIENMDIAAEDDGIVLKSVSLRPMDNVVIRNNTVKSNINAIKIGTETHGPVRNVHVHDNRVTFAGRAALTVQCVDGGHVENITFEDITIDKANTPIFLRLGGRLRAIPDQPDPEVGTLRNVTFRRITCAAYTMILPPNVTRAPHLGSAITGIPGHMIENVVLEDLDFVYPGGIADRDATYANVPERPRTYPNPDRFGNLAAYGLYFRHVRGVTMNNVRIRYEESDRRSAIVFHNAHDVRISDVRVQRHDDESAPAVEFFAGSDGSAVWVTVDAEHEGICIVEGRLPADE